MNVKRFLFNTYIGMCKLFYKPKKEVLFVSFNGSSYSDNPRAISEKLHEICPKIKIKWLIKGDKLDSLEVPTYVKKINYSSRFATYKAYASAKVFVTNFVLPLIKKSPKQRFIQTWHGDKAFKKVLYDSGYRTDANIVYESQKGYCDLTIAGSRYGVEQYRSAFRYTGEILNFGTPRNDRLINIKPEEARKIKDKIKISEDVKILLYAPTLRQKNQEDRTLQEIQELDLVKTLDSLQERDNCKYVCLLRAHPAIVGLSTEIRDNRIIDVSKYPDMADLLLISDVLITDYSSCAGDFALTGKHIYLFQSDRKEYLEEDRSCYFDINDSPYLVATSQEELNHIIKVTDDEKAKQNCSDILDFYGNTETGKASEIVCKKIIEWVYEGKRNNG